MKLIATDPAAARIETLRVSSDRLSDLRFQSGEPRHVSVYLPAGYDQNTDRYYPVLYCLAPWTSSGRISFSWSSFKESLPDRLGRLVAQKQMPACIVVAPDLYTDLGGSQFINSSCLGPHADYLVKDLFPFIEDQFRVMKGGAHRGAFGRSSGGYGALRLAMDYPGEIGAVACHSGDMGFDQVYRGDLVDLCSGLVKFKGDVGLFIDSCLSANKIGGKDVHLLMLIGMAASYSPDEGMPQGLRLPIDLRTGALLEDVWQQWLAHDPVHLIENHNIQKALQKLSCLFIECGTRDQYNLLYGARQFVDALTHYGIDHQYQEFDDNHSGTDYRYDISLPLLSEALLSNHS